MSICRQMEIHTQFFNHTAPTVVSINIWGSVCTYNLSEPRLLFQTGFRLRLQIFHGIQHAQLLGHCLLVENYIS
jgi:hypothetical protein